MIRLILKNLWINRSKNGILFGEIILICIVFIIAFQFLYKQIETVRKPLGYNYENTVSVILLSNNIDTTLTPQQSFFTKLGKIDGVLSTCRADRQSQPFSGSTSNGDASTLDTTLTFNRYGVDEHYAGLLGLQVKYGRWFNKNDSVGQYKPVVITSKAALKLFGRENPLNETFKYYKDSCQIIGVSDDFRRHDFDQVYPGVFLPDFVNGKLSKFRYSIETFLIKFRGEPTSVNIREIYDLFQNHDISITHRILSVKTLKEFKSEMEIEYKILFYGIVFIVLFLLLNIMVGMAGLLWQAVQQRRYEFALRMAVGATKKSVRNQIIIEMIILVVLAFIPALIVVSQINMELLEWKGSETEKIPLTVSLTIMLLLTLLFAIVPASRASKTQPAIALKGE